MPEAKPAIAREMICETVKRLHPAAFVHMEPDQPVLVDDGHCWLLFFDDWGMGCRFTCDGEDMGIVADMIQLEQVVVTVAVAYRELDEPMRERAAEHVTELAGLSGTEVYTRAKAHALAQLGEA